MTNVTALLSERLAVANAIGRHEGCSDAEWALRVDLAAAYRMIDHLGWTELQSGHVTIRVPGESRHFLINPYGLLFDEVTASNLVKIDVDGKIASPTPYQINPAGFVIHSAIHQAREDAHCVFHIHTVAGMAVAALDCGLLPISMPSTGFYGKVAYHELEGTGANIDEREKIVANLGSKNVLILRNHGLLTCGRTVAEAFVQMFRLQRACEIQVAAQACNTKLHFIRKDVSEKSADEMNALLDRGQDGAMGGGIGSFDFAAMVRLMDRKDPSFRS
jgi:ribulose-5-phosphate 4-epimerase/fuculose-1-phosphate aldolase